MEQGWGQSLAKFTWQSILSVIPPCPGMLSPKSCSKLEIKYNGIVKIFEIQLIGIYIDRKTVSCANLDFESSLKTTSKEASKRCYYWCK